MPAATVNAAGGNRPDLWDLAETAAAGGPAGIAAFAALYDATCDTVYGYVWRRTGSRDLAQDVTAETYLRALRGIATLRTRAAGSPVAWLFRIAYCVMSEQGRKPRAVPFAQFFDDGPTVEHLDRPVLLPELVAADRDTSVLLWERVRLLDSEWQRDVLVLRYLHDMTHDEVSTVLGKPVSAVKALHVRALRALRCDPHVKAILTPA